MYQVGGACRKLHGEPSRNRLDDLLLVCERLGRNGALRVERLELRQGLVRVPTVLGEAHVRELVVERRDLLQLEDERLLLVGLHSRQKPISITAEHPSEWVD